MTVDINSKIKDIYNTRVGKDLLDKILLQLGKGSEYITNPLVGNIKLRSIQKLVGRSLPDSFFDALLTLVNSDQLTDKEIQEEKRQAIAPVEHAWWKEAVFYQIYPRSFCDANGDGIGDLAGIISKLDYLEDLGVNALWLSPIYDSPMDDNGYDIRDYRKILTQYGTMEEFDTLLAEAHKRGMRLIMDLVVNHTSDEHEWFQKALTDPEYEDYYFFRDKPNNWTSYFSGSAWKQFGDKYALHLFSKKQMDLNWDNPKVRYAIYDMVNWWLDKGIDGFRLDVINFISKQEGLPDGDETIAKMMGYCGVERYFYGPHLHEYLKELRANTFDKYGAFSVGETPGVGMNMAKMLTGSQRKELDMIFSFDVLESPGHSRFDDYQYDINYFKKYMIDWMKHYGNNCWMSIFYNNHDNPRMVSKIGEPKYNTQIKKLLAGMQMTMKGTPFIFQGDEMGLENYQFNSIDEINDVESKGYYKELCEKMSEKEAFKIILAGTREHARVLLPWDGPFKGQKADPSILHFYRNMIKLRRQNPVLVYGDFRVIDDLAEHFVYERYDDQNSFIIDCNLGKSIKKGYFPEGYHQIITHNRHPEMEPYEIRIWMKG